MCGSLKHMNKAMPAVRRTAMSRHAAPPLRRLVAVLRVLGSVLVAFVPATIARMMPMRVRRWMRRKGISWSGFPVWIPSFLKLVSFDLVISIGSTYVLLRTPSNARTKGARPMELRIKAACARPALGFSLYAIVRAAPAIRTRASERRYIQLACLPRPCFIRT